MHICFIANEFPLPGISFGGVGTFLVSYSKVLIDNGHRVSIVGVSRKEVQTEIDGIRIYYSKHSTFNGLAWYFNSVNISKTIKSIHKKNPINIIEAQEGGFAFITTPKGVKKVIRMHGGHHFFHSFENKSIHPCKAYLERASFKKCDAVISTSEFVKTETEKHIDFSNKINATINNPILMDRFHAADVSKIEVGAFVFAGTICEKKGIRQLCFAIPQIIKQFPEFHLYAYGRDWTFPDGRSYKNWLVEQLSEEIKEHVSFMEPVPYSELPQVYEYAEVCIFPSHMEVQGLVAPEAMSMQKVVIFTEYGPGRETIDDGINGFLCQPKQIDSIAKTVIKVLKARSNHIEIGENARKKVASKFEPKLIYTKNMILYKELLSESLK
jgi:glycosyltransferase involved in cell wall biosynthesis